MTMSADDPELVQFVSEAIAGRSKAYYHNSIHDEQAVRAIIAMNAFQRKTQEKEKVYAVMMGYDYEGEEVLKIFSTREKAELYLGSQ